MASISGEFQGRIRQYLQAVESRLSRLPQEERHEILQDLESHIREALVSRGGAPTKEDLETVLAKMDPPESYAESSGLRQGALADARFCRLPIIGAFWIPFFFVFLALSYSRHPEEPAGTHVITLGAWLARLTLLPLGISAPFGTTILGLLGISRIRKSGGRWLGLPLALGTALFFPLLLLDAGIGFAGHALSIHWPITMLVVAGLDFGLVRIAWRASRVS